MKKRVMSRPVDGLVRHPGLYRAQLSCKTGRDALDGKTPCPDGVQPMEYALFNLLHAVEEIATAMMPNAQANASERSGDSVEHFVGE